MSDYRPDAASFGAEHYAASCGQPYCRNEHWLAFFGAIADRIVSDIHPRRTLDAGCALGLLVETLRARGVDAEGVDVSTYAISRAHEDVAPYLRRARSPTNSGPPTISSCRIEVLEHMPAQDAEAAIANFCRHPVDVLFSSSPLDYGETTHVNVRPPDTGPSSSRVRVSSGMSTSTPPSSRRGRSVFVDRRTSPPDGRRLRTVARACPARTRRPAGTTRHAPGGDPSGRVRLWPGCNRSSPQSAIRFRTWSRARSGGCGGVRYGAGCSDGEGERR